jgi:2-dehydropantoate 2-reductase
MRIAVLGVGAVGGLLAARLLASGTRVTLIENPARAALLASQGLRLRETDGSLACHRDFDLLPADLPAPHDLVLLAVKAHEIAGSLPVLSRVLHAGSTLVTLQNGLPWWYFLDGTPQGASQFAGRTLASVDPGGAIAAAIGVRQIVGCVAYPAAEVETDGTVRHVEGARFTLGEPDGSRSARVEAVAKLLSSAGFKAPVTDDIRAELWLKNWGNLCFNPLSALTGATMAALCRHAPTRDLAVTMMTEARSVAEGLGVTLRVSLERRLAGAEAVGEHRTSMLQDLDRGRPLEHDAVLGAVVELADWLDLRVPA